MGRRGWKRWVEAESVVITSGQGVWEVGLGEAETRSHSMKGTLELEGIAVA